MYPQTGMSIRPMVECLKEERTMMEIVRRERIFFYRLNRENVVILTDGDVRACNVMCLGGVLNDTWGREVLSFIFMYLTYRITVPVEGKKSNSRSRRHAIFSKVLLNVF